MSSRKGVDPEQKGRVEEWGRAEREETIIRVCCKRKQSIFKLAKERNIQTVNLTKIIKIKTIKQSIFMKS